MCNSKHAGKQAGGLGAKGYLVVGLDGGLVYAHRVIWAMTTGKWPICEIDHIDRNRANNHRSNLREAVLGSANQQQNKRRQRNNTSGYPGVSWHVNHWRARISVDGKTLFLGHFDTPEEAHAAYLAAKRVHHPFQPEPRLQ